MIAKSGARDFPVKRYYRPDEVARLLQVSRSYVYYLIRTKQLKAVKIGRLLRIPREEYICWINRSP